MLGIAIGKRNNGALKTTPVLIKFICWFKYPDVAQLVEIGPKGMLAKQHVCGFKSRRPVDSGY